jgi:hypothetical protein
MANRPLLRTLAAALMLPWTATVAQAQLAQLVGRAPDGLIRLSFATRPQVCGDGTFVGEDTPRGFRMYSFHDNGYGTQTLQDVAPECRNGPMLMVVTKANGQVTDLDVAVGVHWRPRPGATDLGTVSAPQAATWLLDLAQKTSSDQMQSVAFLAAGAADSTRIADRLLTMVRDRGFPADTRSRAIRWLGDAARREGRSNDADDLLRRLIRSNDETRSVRERAIRELDTTSANEAFLKDAYRTLGETELRERIIRTLGASAKEGNVGWVRGIVTDASQPTELRERALRVLAEDLHRTDEVRTLYASLTESELRDRAARLLAADMNSAELAGFYDREPAVQVKQRLIKVMAERGDQGSVEKLLAIADRDPNPDLRRYATRRLSDTNDPRARAFLEKKVLR